MLHRQEHTTTEKSQCKQFNFAMRHKLEGMVKSKSSISFIAKTLGFHRSTIYRELKRGRVTHIDTELREFITYSADRAHEQNRENVSTRGTKIKIAHDHRLNESLKFLIEDKRYSPYAALTHCMKNKNSLGIVTSICFKTLYNYINQFSFPVSAETLEQLIQKRHRKKRGKKRQKREAFNNKMGKSIEERPKEANERSELGHHEMDLVVGKQNGSTHCLVVLTERLSRFEHIIKVPDKSQNSIRKALNKIEAHYGKVRFRELFKTITCDNGSEFLNTKLIEDSRWKGKTKRTQLYYAHPYCSSERGSNENANRLIRRFIPKGTDIENFSQEQITTIARWMNRYPRILLDGRCSAAVAKVFTFHNISA